LSIAIQAFLVCQSVTFRKPSGVCDIQGVLDAITASKLPVELRNCIVHCRAYVEDEAKCVVSMILESPTLAKTQIMKPQAIKLNPNGIFKLIYRVDRFSFAESGIYSLRLLINGKNLSVYHVTVLKRTEKRPSVQVPASSGNGIRTFQTPRGQFLDRQDVHSREQQLLENAMAGTGKPHDAAQVAEQILELVYAECAEAGGVHNGTVLTILGTLAGFAVQMAIREEFVKSGKLSMQNAFTTITTSDGSTYYFGDLLNEGLVQSQQGNPSVWTIVGAAAQRLGAKTLLDPKILFERVSRTVGSKDFGIQQLPPECMPAQRPIDLLDKFWNPVRNHLAASVSSPGQWPLVLALAAEHFMLKSKDVVEPGLAALTVMEAAVPMSRVDPRRVHRAYFRSTGGPGSEGSA
jgi:hypothetical protein